MSAPRFSPTAPAIDNAVGDAALGARGSRGDARTAAPLEAGETVVDSAEGVVLGWQARTILIWWLPGLAFTAIAWLESHAPAVTIGVFLFCAALFGFYASDREVRPRGRAKSYLLTNRRLLVGSAAPAGTAWRPVDLADVARTHMEEGLVDRAVARLSGAATIVLELREPGPKGEPRRLRIGPMRRPLEFRGGIDQRIGGQPR